MRKNGEPKREAGRQRARERIPRQPEVRESETQESERREPETREPGRREPDGRAPEGREPEGREPKMREPGKGAKAGGRETSSQDSDPSAGRRRHPHPTLPHQGGGLGETEREGPRWRRRKEDRPGDISAAALQVFAEKGFAGARIEEIARRAGLSKGALYLYFPTKEALFRAVVRDAVIPNIDSIQREVAALDLPFALLVRTLLPRFAQIMTTAPLGAVAKMVIGESRNFPELARVWHEDVVQKGIGLLSGLVERAQQRGEVRAGDPRIHALSLMGPIVLGVIWRETFTPIGAPAFDLPTIARQHIETVLGGLLIPEGKA